MGIEQVQELVSGRAVFGEAYAKNGVTMVPVARVRTASRGGSGPAAVDARPVGAFVIKGDDVRWMPAFDLNRVIFMGQVVVLAGIFSWLVVATQRTWRR